MSLFCPECHKSYADDSMRVCPQDGTRLYKVDDRDPLIGGVIDGRFRIDYTLGVGGMGTVYGGVQLSVNRDVAIKVLRTELSTREVALERFFREAKTISRLSHPNIVRLIDFGQDHERGVLYLVMELVRGQNLADLISRGRLRTALALDVVYQVCGALTEPHAEGVIHRDLKPDNLLLVPVSDGTLQVKVLDFGIARFMESNTQLTGTGMICGTPAYMAPEQAQNEALDARTDLYALGVILYEMLSGWPPFVGTSSLQIMLKHIQEAPPNLREILPPAALPEPIEEFVYNLMSKERGKRPESALDVRSRIDALRRAFSLDPVQVGGTVRELDETFSPFLLPKLPRADAAQSGPTQVLRRETGLQQAPKFANDTAADPVLGVTGPLTPEQRLEVAADGGAKVATKLGGQQAWTPDGQRAVHSARETGDGFDAFGATEASVVHAPPSSPRRTMVEDSEQFLATAPRTEEVVEVPAPVQPTATRERLAAPAASPIGYGPLVAVALFATACVGVAAFFATRQLDALRQPPPPAPVVLAPVQPPPAPATPATEPAPDPAHIDVAVATTWAQRSVHDGVRAAARARPAKPTGASDQGKATKAASAPAPVAEPREAKPATTDRLIQNLGLRKD